MYFAQGLTVRERFAKSLIGADYMSRELYFETTKSHIVCVGGPVNRLARISAN